MKKMFLAIALGVILIGPPVARAQDAQPEDNPIHQQTVEWIKENNKFGVDAKIVTDMTELIDRSIQAHENFLLSFGENLIQSGKPHVLASWDGQVFVFQLSPEQARRMDLKSSSVNQTTGKMRAKREVPPLARVAQAKVTNATHLDGSQKTNGEVNCQILSPLPNNTAVRLSYSRKGSTTSSFYYAKNLPSEGETKISFSFPAINSPSDKERFSGPLPAFLDLATINQANNNVEIKLISNTVGVLLDIQSGADNTPMARQPIDVIR